MCTRSVLVFFWGLDLSSTRKGEEEGCSFFWWWRWPDAGGMRNSQCHGYAGRIQISGIGPTGSGSPNKELCNGSKMSNLFKEKHGTIICRSLLPAAEASQTAPQPSARTAEYYTKRPCSKYVEDAARIAGRMLKNELD